MQNETVKQGSTVLLFTDGAILTGDALVTRQTAAALLGIKQSSFDRNVAKMIAHHGLQRVKTGGTWKYRLKSIEAVIKRCAEKEIPLYEAEKRGSRDFLKK